MGRRFAQTNNFGLGELLFLAGDFGGNELAVDSVGDKNRFAVVPSDAAAAKRDVVDFEFDLAHFIDTLLQRGVKREQQEKKTV